MNTTATAPNSNLTPPPPAPDAYLNKAEVALRLRKKVRTIENWMRRGILPYYKLGHTVSFRWSDIQAHLDANYRRCARR